MAIHTGRKEMEKSELDLCSAKSAISSSTSIEKQNSDLGFAASFKRLTLKIHFQMKQVLNFHTVTHVEYKGNKIKTREKGIVNNHNKICYIIRNRPATDKNRSRASHLWETNHVLRPKSVRTQLA